MLKRKKQQQEDKEKESQQLPNLQAPSTNSKSQIRQTIKKINIFLIVIFIIASISLTNSIFYLQSQASVTSSLIDNNTTTLRQQQQINQDIDERQDDIINDIFSSQVTTTILSTLIIAVVGVVITKLRNFKKKFDMVEVIVRVQAKMKIDADKREQELENRMCKFEEKYAIKFKDLYDKIDETNDNIDKVKDEATKALIDFLSRKKD